MNIRSIDLNLLTILNALLDEAHVSRAAARLGMSQPAVSSALERCRRLFDDPLLERAGRAMRLTAKAQALRAPLAGIIAGVGDLVTVGAPALADLRRTVRIVMADLLAATLAPSLHERVAAAAPGIDLVLLPWGGGDSAAQALVRGTTDLVVSVLPAGDADIERETVAEASYLALMRRDHPAVPGFDLNAWLGWPHLVVSPAGATRTPVDEALAAMGRERRIGMVVSSFLLVADLVRRSSMIALVPVVGAPRDEAGLIALPPPIAVEGFALHLGRHRRHRQDSAIGFVADQVRVLLA